MALPQASSSGTHRKRLKLSEWLPSEASSQAQVIQWAQMMEARYPKLRLLHASMNGILTDPKFGAKLKRLGRKAGVPDLFLPVVEPITSDDRSLLHSGLWIEMKRKGGKVRSEQTEWHEALTDEGYMVVVAFSARDAIAAIKDYMGMPE